MRKVSLRSSKSILTLVAVLVSLVAISSLHAKPKVTCEVKKVSEHSMLITFEWHVGIQSDKAWDGCGLKISFRDGKGQEVYNVKETIAIRIGQNSFSGMEICEPGIWNSVVRYVTTLDCVF